MTSEEEVAVDVVAEEEGKQLLFCASFGIKEKSANKMFTTS